MTTIRIASTSALNRGRQFSSCTTILCLCNVLQLQAGDDNLPRIDILVLHEDTHQLCYSMVVLSLNIY